MNQEKFKLWRLALSTIHLDGKVTEEEQKWFQDKIKYLDNHKILNFSDQQIQELSEILNSSVKNFIEEFNELKSPADCAQLLHLIRIISHVDNDFSADEKEIFNSIEKACLSNVDLAEIERTISTMETESYHEKEVYKRHNPTSLFEKWFLSAMTILNPGDYDFPDD